MARKTAAETAKTRARILRAARRLFADKGYADASLGEVASRAGVTKGGLYHHFRDKRDLFAAVFDELERELEVAARRAALASGLADARGAFLAGCRAVLEFGQRPDFHRVVMAEGPAVLGLDRVHATDSTRGMALMVASVKGLIAAGVIERRPVRPLAVQLFGAVNESCFALVRGDPDVDLDVAVETLARLVDGLAPSAARGRARRNGRG
jgi:AcrR family transcriptional regulator